VFQQTRARLIHERGRLPAVRARRRRRLVVGSLATLAVVAGLVGYQALRTRDCVTGQYFAGPDHDELVYQRRDCVIDFDWEMGPPGGDVPADDFSVRWEGELEIEADGLYTFELSSDDGSRLFIDGRLVIDHWSDHGFSPLQGSIRLSEGRQPFRVEYYDRDGLAAVRLSWRKDDGPSEVVPAAAMVAP